MLFFSWLVGKTELITIDRRIINVKAATTFFKKSLKYDVDETCPYNTIYEQFDYEILSR